VRHLLDGIDDGSAIKVDPHGSLVPALSFSPQIGVNLLAVGGLMAPATLPLANFGQNLEVRTWRCGGKRLYGDPYPRGGQRQRFVESHGVLVGESPSDDVRPMHKNPYLS
jgi:hypothetical protein